MVAVTYYGYGVSATSQANKPAFSLKGALVLQPTAYSVRSYVAPGSSGG
jgi:hypothetical protein